MAENKTKNIEDQVIISDSVITEVTVYPSGALVTRRAQIMLNAGPSRIKIENLPDFVDLSTLTVDASGDFTMVSFDASRNFLAKSVSTKPLRELLQSLEDAETALKKLNAETSLIAQERELLKANLSLSGDAGLKIDDLKAAVNFFRERHAELNAREITNQNAVDKAKREVQSLQSQVSASKPETSYSKQVVIEVSAEKQAQAVFLVSYYIACAKWTPKYEIKSGGVGTPIELVYSAKISQTSSEDWVNCNLRLSTATPAISNNIPDFSTEYLDINRPRPLSAQGKFRSAQVDADMCMDECLKEEASPMACFAAAPAVAADTSQTSVDYELKEKITIYSNASDKSVRISAASLPSEYRYFSMPKLDTDAFLTARVKDFAGLRLLPAEGAIYLNNKYIGKTYVNPEAELDYMVFCLGRDKSIAVKRVLSRNYSASAFIGNNEKTTREWTIDVKNNKAIPIEIEVVDQLPVPVNKAVSVDAAELSGAQYDKSTGKLSWVLTLKPAAASKLSVKYSFTKPKS